MFISIFLCYCAIVYNTQFVETHRVARLLEFDSVLFENCTTHDIRNIAVYHTEPNQIIIKHCFLPNLPNAIFIRFYNATYLEITDSKLTKIQDYAFNGLNNLQILNLSKNNLTEIRSWSIVDIFTLHTIDLRRNHITTIKSNSLKNYPNLLKLNVAVNNINGIDDDAFKLTPLIRTINLGKNFLTHINDMIFNGLAKLQHLSLHHNKIMIIDTFAFATNTHLKTLRLDGNQLKIFDGVLIDSLSRLTHLNLSHNMLNHLNEKTFHKNIELKMLDLSYNSFINFAINSFNGLQMLEVFNASHNSIELLYPLTFREFNHIKLLDLSGNNITYLFDGIFEYLPDLKHLNLSRNAIDVIQTNVFMDLIKLEQLDLSFNYLTTDHYLHNLNSLLYLNISNNMLKTINLTNLYNLNVIELNGNPWLCSWLLKSMMDHKSTGIHFGKDYVIDGNDVVRKIPGIQCMDDVSGVERNILVIGMHDGQDQEQQMDKIIIQERSDNTEYDASSIQTKTMIYDDFDFRACLIWTVISLVIVYGIVQIGKFLSKKSERQSEQWRISQQVSLLNASKHPVATRNSHNY